MPSASVESRRRPADPTADLDWIQQRERCPRCDSTDTKFCYYNNYNTSQPRHFCKSCRRYWTLGGSLRNVPIGGSTRKRLRTTTQLSKPSRTNTITSVLPPNVFGSNGFLPSQLVALGGPFLQGRVGFELGLGLNSRSGSGLSSDNLDQTGLGFGLGNGHVMWPMSMMNELGGLLGNESNVDTWKMEIGRMEDQVPVPVSAIWQELALSVPAETAHGLEAHLL